MQLLPNGNFVLVHSKVDKQQKCNPFNVFDAICIMQKLFFVNVIDKNILLWLYRPFQRSNNNMLAHYYFDVNWEVGQI